MDLRCLPNDVLRTMSVQLKPQLPKISILSRCDLSKTGRSCLAIGLLLLCVMSDVRADLPTPKKKISPPQASISVTDKFVRIGDSTGGYLSLISKPSKRALIFSIVEMDKPAKLAISGASVTIPAGQRGALFSIKGVHTSKKIGDAILQLRFAGKKVGSNTLVTVFNIVGSVTASLTKPPGYYGISGKSYKALNGTAIQFSARAFVIPKGVPAPSGLQYGLIQNVMGTNRSSVFSLPAVAWVPGITKGTAVQFPSSITMTLNFGAVMDNYPGLSVPWMRGTAVTSLSNSAGISQTDNPSTVGAVAFAVTNSTRTKILATITYKKAVVSVNDSFKDWVVLTNGTSMHPLAECAWSLSITNTKAKQHATPGSSKKATSTPIYAVSPVANDEAKSPANNRISKGSTVTKRHP